MYTLVGLLRYPINLAVGSNPCRSSRRCADNKVLVEAEPVILPPGRARLCTKPASTGSTPRAITIGTPSLSTNHTRVRTCYEARDGAGASGGCERFHAASRHLPHDNS